VLNIVLPIAGRGSRFAVAGYAQPKPLIPVR
jgi:UTP-glucose-1-phosphate uridylyltransferase